MLMKQRLLSALCALAIVFSAFGATAVLTNDAFAAGEGKTIEIWLTRHGETVANLNDRCNGWSNSPLTQKGLDGSRFVGLGLKEKGITFDAFYSSTLGRCVQTTQIIQEQIGQTNMPIWQDKRLREMNMGDYDLGPFVSGFMKDFPNTYDFENFPGVPGGEDWESLWARMEPALYEIAEINARPEGGRVLVASHGWALLTMLIHLDPGFEFKGSSSLPNNCITILEYKDGKLTVKLRPTAEYSQIGMKAAGVTAAPASGH